MQARRKWAVAGLASVLLTATPAIAGNNDVHTLTLQLPNGVVEHIQYRGDVAPRVSLDADVASPFAELARLSDMLDRQTALMLRDVSDPGAAPMGFEGSATVVTYTSDGICTRRTQVTYPADGMKPRSVSDTNGRCGTAPEPAAHTAPDFLQVRDSPRQPGLIRQAFLQN